MMVSVTAVAVESRAYKTADASAQEPEKRIPSTGQGADKTTQQSTRQSAHLRAQHPLATSANVSAPAKYGASDSYSNA
jgi:hypothetical protein